MHQEQPAVDLVLIAGSANRQLAASVAEEMGVSLWPAKAERFPDGEARVEIETTVRDRDVYLIQPTSPTVAENLIELLFFADAARRAGARRVTAVIPYFGYARQDRRSGGREAVGARVVCDLIAATGIDRVVALDLHSPAIEGFLSVPLEHLSAVPLVAAALQRHLESDPVVVAPDLGAAKLAERYAGILDVPVAIIRKTRLGPQDVKAISVIGDVQGKSPVIVDDMISTGGTILAAAGALVDAGCRPRFTVAATHGLFVGPCQQRFASLPIIRLLATDSVIGGPAELPIEKVRLAPLFAEALRRIHRGQPVSGLVAS